MIELQDHITLEPAAYEAALRLQREHPPWLQKPLRLYIEGKGCDGFYYGVSFDEALADDLHFSQGGGLELVVDKDTFGFVKGSHIQWVDDDRGQGFLVVNPAHKSYRGKFYRRKSWQEKLKNRQSEASEPQSIEAKADHSQANKP